MRIALKSIKNPLVLHAGDAITRYAVFHTFGGSADGCHGMLVILQIIYFGNHG